MPGILLTEAKSCQKTRESGFFWQIQKGAYLHSLWQWPSPPTVFSGCKDSDAPNFRWHRPVGTCLIDAFLIWQASVSAKRSPITADRACRPSQLGPFWANRDGRCGDHHVAGPYQQHMLRFGSNLVPNDQANAGVERSTRSHAAPCRSWSIRRLWEAETTETLWHISVE